jgi:signal transduction histidine kinase
MFPWFRPVLLASRLPLPRRTIRLRLTLIYSALFLLAGALLLTVTYLLVRFTFPTASTRSYLVGHPPAGDAHPLAPPPPALAAIQAENARQRDADLHQLLAVSAVALAIMGGVSLLLGWVVAGRVLRPLRTITATVRDLSSATLDRRLALPGPDDELKELGDTFDDLLGRLQRSFASQRQFVANASHDLRTPLTLQRALLEAVLADPAATPTSLRGTFDRLLAVAAEQERLIEALLTLATSERGVERWEPFDLADLAEAVLTARRGDAARLRLRTTAELEPAPAVGDPDLVERLVANLVDNALHHNTPGGQIEIATGTERGDSTVTVINSGPVVPPDRIAGLFEPFRRLGAGRSRHSGGHGLGLSIVAAIAASHHARLRARPGANGGLVVSAAFPTGTHRQGPTSHSRR